MENYEDHFPPLAEEDVAINSKLEHLYNHEFKEGRSFQVVFADNNETHIKFAPRTVLKVIYLKEKDDIEGLQLIKVVSGKDTERVKLSKFNLQQLKCFLEFINSIDLKGVSNRRISLADNSLGILDQETKKKITTLLSGNEGSDIVINLLKNGFITNQDLVNTGYRKQELEKFRKMLYENWLDDYKIEIKKQTTKDETAWQYFFMSN